MNHRIKQRVLAQSLWYNSMIKVDNKVLISPIVYANDLKTVGDIWDGNGFKLYNKDWGLTWLEYNSILAAIPSFWKFALKQQNSNDTYVLHFEMVQLSNFTNRVYQPLILTDQVNPTSVKRWSQLLGPLFRWFKFTLKPPI